MSGGVLDADESLNSIRWTESVTADITIDVLAETKTLTYSGTATHGLGGKYYSLLAGGGSTCQRRLKS